MTVGEIAAEFPQATREFEKLGIDYCCGGKRTLDEACSQAGISVAEALERLQRGTATRPDSAENWHEQPLADLIDHITSTHHVFVREECPRIEALAAKVVGVHGKRHPELLQVQQVFTALAAELSVHLMFTESEASSGDRPWKLRSHSPVRIEYRYGPLEVERSRVRTELESAYADKM